MRGRFLAPEAKEADDIAAGIERLGGGQWQLVISEIPYQVPKGKLIEQIAQAITDRKLPILEDVRDESDEAIRIVLVPKSRNVDPELLKESLFKLTDLETRFSLNLNVLDATRTPMVMGLKELLDHWTASQIDILQRRARHRLDQIERRLELVRGYIIAFLNLDRVIEIIRTEDEPKPLMMAEFELTDRQAEAILNMRLRSLRKLEEMQLRKEQDELLAEQDELDKLLESPARQRTRLKRDLKALRKDYCHEGHRAGRGRPARWICPEAEPVVEIQHGRDDREGAGHRDPEPEGLDPRSQGARAARPGIQVQGRRCARLHPSRPDHRQAAAGRLRRAVLHDRLRQAARRTRLWRAGGAP